MREQGKQGRVLQQLRRQIVRGSLPPGGRLPTRQQLSKQMKVSLVTVQRALAALTADEFIVPRGKRGTFVADHPPHLFAYGLVFESSLGSLPSYYRDILHAVAQMSEQTPIRFQAYTGIDGHQDVEDYQRLVRDIEAHRLAGLIFFMGDLALLEGTPVLDAPHIARVANVSRTNADSVCIVKSNYRTFLTKALDYLAQQDCRRVAMIGYPGVFIEEVASFERLLKKDRMICPPHWRLSPYPDRDATARCVQLLMHAPVPQRPQGLIITDQAYLDGAIAGLVAAGVRVPDDLRVVSHCVFPAASAPIMPVKLLGYDAYRCLEVFVDTVDQLNRGQTLKLVQYDPIFDHERPIAVCAADNEPVESTHSILQGETFHV